MLLIFCMTHRLAQGCLGFNMHANHPGILCKCRFPCGGALESAFLTSSQWCQCSSKVTPLKAKAWPAAFNLDCKLEIPGELSGSFSDVQIYRFGVWLRRWFWYAARVWNCWADPLILQPPLASHSPLPAWPAHTTSALHSWVVLSLSLAFTRACCEWEPFAQPDVASTTSILILQTEKLKFEEWRVLS